MQVRADWSLSLQHHPGDKPPEGRQQQGVEVSGDHQRKHQAGVSRLHIQVFVWRCSHWSDSSSWRQLSRPPAHQPHHALCGSTHHGHHRELHNEGRQEEGQNICSGHRAPGSELLISWLLVTVSVLVIYQLFSAQMNHEGEKQEKQTPVQDFGQRIR